MQLDEYRVAREWDRYEGTAQRDLFRELRERFLLRHAQRPGWALEVGPGPGRFSKLIGGPGARLVLIDLSERMLRAAARRTAGDASTIDLVRGDAARLPVRGTAWSTVVALGNVVGFAESDWRAVVGQLAGSVAPGGTLLLEIAPGIGERSTYLGRLPPGAVRRLLRAPIAAVRPRIEREGFAPGGAASDGAKSFVRLSIDGLAAALSEHGLDVDEAVAVAPALGGHPDHAAAVRADAKAWAHLLELEETLGRSPDRMASAAAVLVSARRPQR